MFDRERRNDLEPDLQLPPFPSGMTASEAEFAADLSAVQADDALLDALGGSDPEIGDGLGDLELNALLLAWRRDIDSEPLADLVDTDTAVTTVKTAALAQKYGRRRRRLLVPVAAAAAVLAIAFSGTGLAAREAQPGDTLWGLTKVLYADHARSVEAATAARIDLEKANIAIAGGRTEDARRALNDAQVALNQVSTDDNLAQLMEQHRQLIAQLQGSHPAPVPAPASPAPGTGPSQPSAQPAPPAASPTSQLPPGTGGTPSPTSSQPVETSTPPPTPSTTPPATGNDPGSPRYDPSSSSPPPPTASP